MWKRERGVLFLSSGGSGGGGGAGRARTRCAVGAGSRSAEPTRRKVPFGDTAGGRRGAARAASLHVEYAEQRIRDGILFICSSFYEYSHLGYEHVPVQYRVHQAEDVIRILLAASHEYVNTYSTRRATSLYASCESVYRYTDTPSNPPRVFQRCLPNGNFRSGLPLGFGVRSSFTQT